MYTVHDRVEQRSVARFELVCIVTATAIKMKSKRRRIAVPMIKGKRMPAHTLMGLGFETRFFAMGFFAIGLGGMETGTRVRVYEGPR